ncbi:sulfite exporter TauE/SafE family protein [Kaistia algarum]|nr:sulfite exporter TauE/SafE family protein [Kaistia algarum]
MVFVAALLQGIGGMGFAMVSAPLAVLFFPELVPGPLLVLGAGIAILGMVRECSEIVWPDVGSLVGGRLAGTLIAGLTLSVLPTTLFSTLFAILILTGIAFSLSGWRVVPSVRNMVLAGLASGVMGTITSSGAPPFALVMQNLPPPRLRATISVVFLIGAIGSLAMLAYVHLFGPAEFWLGIGLLPFMILGFIASNPLTRIVPRETVRLLLLALSGCGAIGILTRVWLLRA